MTEVRQNDVKLALWLFACRGNKPGEQPGEGHIGVGGQPGMHGIWLDHGVANIRQPVKPLTEIELGYRSARAVGRSDLGERLQLLGDDVGIYVTAEHSNTIVFHQRIHFQEPLRSAKHDKADIDRFAALDARHQPQHAVQIRNRFTHDGGRDWPGPDQSTPH